MSFDKMIGIKSERILLRYLKESDLAEFLSYRSRPEIAEYQFWGPFTEKDARDYILKYKNEPPWLSGSWTQLGIVLLKEDKLIGDCALRIDSIEPRIGEIGFNLSPDYQGKGYASEAVRALLDYTFDTLNMHRIMGVTDSRNTASVKLMERIGMRKEAHFVKNIWFKGVWGDEYLFAVLKEEWKNA
ncbi:GNAT family N-acetyltransferase [candidate division KSB1 bacterium]